MTWRIRYLLHSGLHSESHVRACVTVGHREDVERIYPFQVAGKPHRAGGDDTLQILPAPIVSGAGRHMLVGLGITLLHANGFLGCPHSIPLSGQWTMDDGRWTMDVLTR